jgi:hypothetical protein
MSYDSGAGAPGVSADGAESKATAGDVGPTGGALVAAPAHRLSSAAIEDAAFSAMNRRISHKRPAAAAAPTGPLMKKPAMAGHVDAVFNWELVYTDTDLEKPRKNFVSMMYHRIKKVAGDAGLKPADATIAANEAFKEAGRVWDDRAP